MKYNYIYSNTLQVYSRDSKSRGAYAPCGFDPHLRHHFHWGFGFIRRPRIARFGRLSPKLSLPRVNWNPLRGQRPRTIAVTRPVGRASSCAAASFRTASRKSASLTMSYRSNTLRVLCPVNCMATFSGTPARTRFRTAVRRKSWRIRCGYPLTPLAGYNSCYKCPEYLRQNS